MINPLTVFALSESNYDPCDLENYQIENSKDGKQIIKMKRAGKEIYIGSKYSVDRDIDLFLSQLEEINIYTIIIVFGLGTGEHLVKLLEKIGNMNKILVVEPDYNIIERFSSTENNKKIIEDNRLVIAPMDPYKIKRVLEVYIDEFNVGNLKLLKFANYESLYSQKYNEFLSLLKDYVEVSVVNINTKIGFSQQFFECFIKNLKEIANSGTINQYKDKFKGCAAVVVSAGPSLDKNIALLNQVKGKFLIVSGGRTIKALEKVHVEPDFVVVVDPGENSYKVMEQSLDYKVPLIYCELTNYKVTEEYSAEKIFFEVGQDYDKITSELIGMDVDTLYQGGSVAHTCTALSQYFGCDPVIFIGQDFAHTNNKFHADSARIGNIGENYDNEAMVEDIYGDLVPTTRLFNTYRRMMSKLINMHQDTTFINCTEGGANIEGTQVMNLQAAIDKYAATSQFDKELLMDIKKDPRIKKKTIIKKLTKIVSELKRIQTDCKEAVKIARNLLNHYTTFKTDDIKHLLERINKLNKEISSAEIIESLLKPTIYRILMNPDYIERDHEPDRDKGLRLARQSEKLYSDIITSINNAMPLLEKCICDIEKENEYGC